MVFKKSVATFHSPLYRLDPADADLLIRDLGEKLERARLKAGHMFLFWLLVVAAYGTTLAYALALASIEDGKPDFRLVWVTLVCVAITLLAALSTVALARRVRSQRRLYQELDLALPGRSASETWKNRPPVERALKSVASLSLVAVVGLALSNVSEFKAVEYPPAAGALLLMLLSAHWIWSERKISIATLLWLRRLIRGLTLVWAAVFVGILAYSPRTEWFNLLPDHLGTFLGVLIPAWALVRHRLITRRQERLAPLADAYRLKSKLERRTGPAAERRGYVGLPMADALRLADVEEAFLRQSRLKALRELRDRGVDDD